MDLVGFLWGDLRPIAGQVVLDGLALVGFGAVAVAQPSGAVSAVVWLMAILLLVVVSSGGNWTNRWTIVFPMIPFAILQTLRQILWSTSSKKESDEQPTKPSSKNSSKSSNKWRSIGLWLIGALSGGLLLAAASLTVLFPAVELPLPDESHLYHVGVVDLFLPKIEFNHSYKDVSFDPSSYNTDHFAIRVLYPTAATSDAKPPSWMPYLRPGLSHAYCQVNMQQGAPPPLKPFDWFVHYWNLIQLPASENAPLLQDTHKLPVVVYSPGLGGTSETYSYQTLSLAARGFVVVVVEHGDGSLAVIPRTDGTAFRRSDDAIAQDWKENRERHDRSRRAMTDYRSEEILATTRFLVESNQANPSTLDSKHVSFVGRLDLDDLHFVGHSFGGASVLHAAYQTTSISTVPTPKSIVAHDPVSNWIPDRTRMSLYDSQRLESSTTNHTKWSTPRDSNHQHQPEQLSSLSSSSIHDFELFLLFSYQWGQNRWEGFEVLQDLQNRNKLGNGLLSKVEIADSAHHIEFSDLSMLTPTWLARGVNMTGSKSPLQTAKDIHTRTLNFLMEVRGKEGFVAPSTK